MAKKECLDLAEKVMKIHDVSDVLTKVWDGLPPERRAESLVKLKKRVSDLNLGPHTTSLVESTHVMENLKILENFNEGKGKVKDVKELLMPRVLKLAVEAILDCNCRESGYMVERDEDKEE